MCFTHLSHSRSLRRQVLVTEVQYGIAFTHNGSPNGEIVGWKKDNAGNIQLWETRDEALEENDLSGWTGYVKEYQ